MIELYNYQADAVDFLASHDRGFVVAPAGSGKTIIAAAALARLRPAARKLWVANTVEQVAQAQAALAQFRVDECDTCCVAAQPDSGKYDVLVMDEAHHCPAVTWRRLVSEFSGILWGLSATPWHYRDHDRNDMVQNVFKNFHEVDRELVLSTGHLAPGKVFMDDIDIPEQFDAEIDRVAFAKVEEQLLRWPYMDAEVLYRRAAWKATLESMVTNRKRTDRIIYHAMQCVAEHASCLILVPTIEYGAALADDINETWKFDTADVIHSKLPKKVRASRIQAFQDGVLRVAVATSLADEGLDVPRASRLILAAGGRSPQKLEQRAGRVLRPFPGKAGGVIYDFLDRGSVMAYSQAQARLRLYRSLGYPVHVWGEYPPRTLKPNPNNPYKFKGICG